MIVLSVNTVAVAVAALPCIVGMEMTRDVVANRRQGRPLRDAMEVAATRAAPTVRWSLTTMLSAIGWWVGLLMLADGIVSIFGHRQRHNPVLMLMLPGTVLLALCFVTGCVALVRAVRATSQLHRAVSART